MPRNKSQNNTNRSAFRSEIARLAPYLAYTNLAITSICAAYRAYSNNDKPTVALIASVILGALLLELCFRALHRLSRATAAEDERSGKRVALKMAVCSISSAILFGFAYHISAFSGLPAALFIFGVVVASSACIFFVYFFHDHKYQGRERVCNGYDSQDDGDESV